MIPARPLADSTGSEAQVFGLLEAIDLGPEAVAFGFVHLSEHEYKKWGEIDFVVLSRDGLVVLEVKGGVASCDESGTWSYVSRGYHPVKRRESPMAQASSAYFSLRDNYLVPAVGADVVRRAPSGFCVALAGTPCDAAAGLVGGTEMPEALVASKEDVRDPGAFLGFLSGVTTHWQDNDSPHPGKWSAAEVAAISRAIRPWCDRVPPLSLSAARLRQEQLVLTEDQYEVLDFAEKAPRLLCTGGAGCGKTLLAVECLRREAQNNPLLVTGTSTLAPHLRASVPELASRIVSFDELSEGSIPGLGVFGSLVVDEGQQLTDRTSFAILGRHLVGGLADGRWRWFSDPHNQVLAGAKFDMSCQEELEQRSFPGSLRHNCRNTPEIAQTVETLTGMSVGSNRMQGRGPDVHFAPGSSRQERNAAAASKLKEWLADPQVKAGEIAILSPLALSQSSAWDIASLAGVPARAWQAGWDRRPSYPSEIAVASIDDFRGLEAPYVLVCDMDADVLDPRRNFYLGLTRANFAAFVVAEPAVVRTLVMELQRDYKKQG